VNSTSPAKEVAPAALALFISDLHLQPSHPRTTQAFLDFLEGPVRRAQALYLLGDIFDAWPGDDDMALPYHRQIIDALRAVSDAGIALFWIAGNRDFLVGPAFAAATGARILSDGAVIAAGASRIVLAHGDAECTDDHKYMQFRAMVREPQWQRQFLSQPLTARRAIVAGLRSDSRAQQQEKPMALMDVNPQAIARLYEQSGAEILIHGHTHRPACHRFGSRLRYVLPDWELDDGAPRGGWIALDASGAIHRYDLHGMLLDDGPA
jgi:UDP-2,3-diacylglucosamine hydrolase